MLLLLNLALVAASIPLMAVIPSNGRVCYHVQSFQTDANIGASFVVMSGGSFDIDMEIKQPDGIVVESVQKSSGDEFAFKSKQRGEYELCFFNKHASHADKKIEFEFKISTDYLKAALPTAASSSTSSIEKYVDSLEERISALARSLQYYKARNSRNQDTVLSTDSRVFWFCSVELILVVAVAALNVFTVQYFFKGSRKNLV